MILLDKLKKIDRGIVVLMLCLVAAGTVAVYRATAGTKLDGLHFNGMMYFGVFCIPMLLVTVFNYRLLTGKLAYYLYAFGIGMLAYVHWKGEVVNGAARWLSIGSVEIQPSEPVKLFTILLAAHLLHKRQGEKLRFVQDLLPVGAVFAIPIVFILKQPDLGTALVFVGIFFGMLWMGNIRLSYMLTAVGAAGVAIGTVLWLYYADNELLAKIIKPHQMSRIQTFLEPASDPQKSWHYERALMAIGSGQLNGNALDQPQGSVPYAYSDSIFAVVGEKYGFLGAAILLMLYLLLVYRMVGIILETKELAGSYLITGMTAMLVFQIYVNIGMHIGLVPLTGISLPFISYGGSSLLTNMVALGLVLNVKIHQGSFE
ncbi:rod shape-determining protein RodA [Paenibacillus sp. MZ04-78.2]|uniref:FtsW/RodA/SpoVE family cell cycle protein n=1 Tax=Paenibacillus sp. MZ04-78.2 TaxID=2962034 RepID=UPI0020B81252|nr:FtsW/RodA/SpoVE family cell cycle protein [Paenibacillus sp. MZ04-78.2]MCP3774087.1 rod shape-determining protein RodA [Paenibacillus sp. MZ04-78.2]